MSRMHYINQNQPLRLWLALPDVAVQKSHQDWMSLREADKSSSVRSEVKKSTNGPALYLGGAK